MEWLERLYSDGRPLKGAVIGAAIGSGEPKDQKGLMGGLLGGILGATLAREAQLVDFGDAVENLESHRERAGEKAEWLDEQTWLEALKTDTIAGYRAYLAEFPDGLYARFAEANVKQLLDPTANDGELDSAKPWIISLGAALPDRYAVDLAEPLAIDGIWRISTNNKRLRIERGRAFAVDGWNHALLFKVKPDQVTTINLREAEPGRWLGRDILLNGDTELALREDGDLDVTVALFPFPARFKLLREGLDNPDALPAPARDD